MNLNIDTAANTEKNDKIVTALAGAALMGFHLNHPEQVAQGVSLDAHVRSLMSALPSWVKEAVMLGLIAGSANANDARDGNSFWGCPDVNHSAMSVTYVGLGASMLDAPL